MRLSIGQAATTPGSVRKDAIWAAVVRDGRAETPIDLRNRQVAHDWLSNLIGRARAAGRRLFAGFDLLFGYPKGPAETLTGRPTRLPSGIGWR